MKSNEITYEVVPINKVKVDTDNDSYYHVYDEIRYIVVDAETGEILDDAQGYGYKSYQKAVKGYHYQRMPKEQKEQLKMLKQKCKEWWKNHESIADDYCIAHCYAARDGEKLTPKQWKEFIQQKLDENNITLEDGLTVNNLYKYF